MIPTVSSITYGGIKIQSREVVTRLSSAIDNKTKFEISDENLGGTAASGGGKACTIEYSTEDGQPKRRSLEEGQTFNFGNDITVVKYGRLVRDPAVFERLFRFMDTAEKFKVETSIFGAPPQKTSTLFCELEYVLPDGIRRKLIAKEGTDFIFKNGKEQPGSANPTPVNPVPIDPMPVNPIPANPTPTNPTPAHPEPPIQIPNGTGTTKPSCQCPCPACAKGHQTDEQRKAAEEQKLKEEKERQQQDDALRKAATDARQAAEDAKKETEEVHKALDQARTEVNQTQKELDEVRKAAEQAEKEREEAASRDKEAASKESEASRKKLEEAQAEARRDAEDAKTEIEALKKQVEEAKRAAEEAVKEANQARKDLEGCTCKKQKPKKDEDEMEYRPVNPVYRLRYPIEHLR